MTYTDPLIIREMLENHGVAAGDEPANRIYAYKGLAPHMCYAAFYRPEHDDIAQAPNVEWWECLFFQERITTTGKLWLLMFNNAKDAEEAAEARREGAYDNAGHRTFVSAYRDKVTRKS